MTPDTTGAADAVDRLIAAYLARLDRAAEQIPAARRAELVDEIRAHIDSARSAGGVDDEAGIRTVLDRLGDPEEIAAVAREDEGPPPAAAAMPFMPGRRRSPVLEIAAFAMLTLGSFLPVLGWLIGVVLLWSSRRWRLGEKLLATLVVPGGPGIVLLVLALVPGQVCTTVGSGPTTCTGFAFPPAIGIPVFLVILISPFVICGVLLHRAVDRAAAEPPVAAPMWWGGREIAAVSLLGPGGVFVPVLAPIFGLVFAWSSLQWTRPHKAVASIMSVTPGVLVLAGHAIIGGVFHILLIAAVMLGPVVAAVYLMLSIRRDTPPAAVIGSRADDSGAFTSR